MSYLETLVARRQKARDEIDTYTKTAEDQGRDLSDADSAAIGELDKQIRELDERLTPLQDAALRDADYEKRQAAVDTALAGKQTRAEAAKVDEPAPADGLAQYRTAGDYLTDWARWKKDDDTTAKHRLYRAIQHQTTGDNPGLLPVPLIGPVSTLLNTARPAINAVTQRGLPAQGKTFQRPKVTQHTIVGVPAAEKTSIPSQKMTVSSDTLTKVTYGGTVNVSQQDLDWSIPSIWDILLQDMYGNLAKTTEAAFATALATAVTAKTTLIATAASDVLLAALYTGAAAVYNATGYMPDTLFASVDQWARLGGLVDGNKRPMFPFLAPQNAMGQMGVDSLAANPLGVRLVVSPGFPAATLILGVSQFAEWYQSGNGQVSVSEPELLGVQVAVYTYAVSYVSQPTAFTYFAP